MIALAKSSPQRDSIYFTNTTFERARIVERGLNIIYTLKFDFDSDDCDLEDVLFVMELAKKWEISFITDFICRDLERNLDSKNGPKYTFDNFIIALKLERNHLAAAYAMGAGKYKGWLEQGAVRGACCKELRPYLCDTPKATLSQKHPLLDIRIEDNSIFGRIPHDFFLCIPPTVVWIILRAQGLKGKTGLSQEEIVRQLLDLACESMAYVPPG